MRVPTLKTQTAANIKFPGYLEYTIKFKYYFHRASGVYGENTRMKRDLREHIYSTYYPRQSGIWPDISRAIFSRAEGECKYTSEMSGHITR